MTEQEEEERRKEEEIKRKRLNSARDKISDSPNINTGNHSQNPSA
jgi:hypothetical protein